MVTIVIVGLLLAIVIHWIRYQHLKIKVISQGETLVSAEVNVLNAALNHEEAASALTQYVKKNGDRRGDKVALESSTVANGEDQLLQSLRRQVELTNMRRRELKVVWEYERLKLKRLKWEMEHIWSLWPSGSFVADATQRKLNLSDQEAAEIDVRLKHFGMGGD
jgi:hypothetical protein